MIDSVAPNFLIAGAARSGTTALARTLVQHPDVFLTEPKEVHFLAHVDAPFTYTGPGDQQSINDPMVDQPEAYRAMFEAGANHRARGEGSVSTLYYADRSIAAIDTYADPDVKIVVVLREPAARAHSAYLYLRGRGFEHLESFEEALTAEQSRMEAGYHHMWHLRGMSRYSLQLPKFHDRFGDRLLILIQEEYREAPGRHLAQVAEFIGVDPGFDFETDIDVNRGGEPKSRLVSQVLSGLRSSPTVKSAVKLATPERLRERIRSANLQEAAKPAGFEALRAEFEADRTIVEELLARPIPSWHEV
jgi:hypothetical protein